MITVEQMPHPVHLTDDTHASTHLGTNGTADK